MSVVHVVHCIDTEGPLHEPLSATFQRLDDIFGIKLEPSAETLAKLQNKQIDLKGLEDDVARTFAPHLLAYNDSWEKIDDMLRHVLSREFRMELPDSFGGGWIYNWHCLDIVGFKANPRRRDMGFHNVFDHYNEILKATGSGQDGVQFHYHPIPFSGSAHHCATHYFSHSPMIFEILARRIIDRAWFPSVNRPGFHTTRPDSHWFMEQFIPFDFASQAGKDDYSNQKDLSNGRYGDWRRAPDSWTPYHPSHDDYQTPGNGRRWIARCLNVGTRLRLMDQEDVNAAFDQARRGDAVVLAFTNHDFRDIRPDIREVRKMLASASRRFPDVQFRYCEGRQAMRAALGLPERKPINFELKLEDGRLSVVSDKPIFGPQPFLAMKLHDGHYFHDNLDFQQPGKAWSYVFDEHTIPLAAIEAIGIAASDDTGNVSVARLFPASGKSDHANC